LLFGQNNLDISSRIRFEMIEVGKTLFLSKPFLGYGIGSFSIVSGFDAYSHNNYIELLVGLGIIGMVLYYSMIIYIIYKLFIIRKFIDGNPLLAILLSLLVIDYGLVSYNSPVYQYIIALGFISIKLFKPKSKIATKSSLE
ncbi:MAG: O-antigen ligase family protein, partial [Burkholderiales bacterium]|nr:O-antigen ligase family protein [Burkholderiales bacterium]